MIGKTISHYSITEALGSGGMGVVYLANDLKLHREVALKVLPEELASRKDRLERFQREARSVAALSHPNIVTIYSVEEADGVHFLTMERVRGQPLSRRIPEHGLDLTTFLNLAVPMADALSAAHAAGITHRDLKPGNVMVDSQDQVKVIDFGLAKQALIEPGSSDSAAPTAAMTEHGRILGTPAYMSPEQVDGAPLDPRSDLFSLGIIFHEMLTGRNPFEGRSSVSVMSAILRDTPALVGSLKPGLPPALSSLIEKCLQKDPAQRPQTAREVRDRLRDFQRLSDRAEPLPPLRPAKRPMAWVPFAIGAVLLLAVVGSLLVRRRPADSTSTAGTNATARTGSTPGNANTSGSPIRFITPAQWSYDPAVEEWPAFSPDGKRLAFSMVVDGFKKVFIREVQGGGQAVQLTEGPTDDIQAAWAPDGKDIAFVRANGDDGRVQASDVWGGFYAGNGSIWLCNLESRKARLIAAEGFHPVFSREGKLAFDARTHGTVSRIWTCDRQGLRATPVTEDADTVFHVEPSWSPDGTQIVFRRQPGKYTAKLAVVDLGTRKITDLTTEYFLSEPAWSPTGRYIYFSANFSSGFNLWRLPVNGQGQAAGGFEPMTFGTGRDVQPSLCRSGTDGATLAYTILHWNSDLWVLPMDPETGHPAGEPQPLVVSSREDTRGVWSADERWLAFTSDRDGEMSLYVAAFDTATGKAANPVRVTKGPGGDYQVHWSPDGRQLVFFSRRSGNEEIWVQRLSEKKEPEGPPVQLTHQPLSDTNPFFSPDGKHIAFTSDRDGTGQVWVMDADGSNQRNLQVGGLGHYTPWYDAESVLGGLSLPKGFATVRAFVDGREPVKLFDGGGAHMTLSPNRKFVADNNHTVIMVRDVANGKRVDIHKPADSSVGVDYTVWSPSGRWILFDRNRPQDADIFLLKGVE